MIITWQLEDFLFWQLIPNRGQFMKLCERGIFRLNGTQKGKDLEFRAEPPCLWDFVEYTDIQNQFRSKMITCESEDMMLIAPIS